MAINQYDSAFLGEADKFSSHPYYWAGFVGLGSNQPVIHIFIYRDWR